MNLTYANYYSYERPYQNYAWLADEHMVSISPIGGSWGGGPALTYNATTGYPNNIVAGNEAVMVLEMNNSEPVGSSFVITWSGPSDGIFVDGATVTGTNTYTWIKSSAGNVNFLVRFRSNSITNLVVRRTGESITGKFRQTFLNRCKRYNTLRFMNWGAINEWNAAITSWSQRIPETHRSQGSLTRGVSYETMIDLCNQTGCNMWINIPHVANDDWCTQLANLILSRRTGNWNVIVEWSNEVWNGIFPQHAYAQAQGGGSPAWAYYEYTILRSQQIAALMRATGLKIEMVLNLQAHTTDHLWYLRDRTSPPPYNLDGINTLSIAPYFGSRAHLTSPVNYRLQLLVGGLTEVFTHCDWHIDNEVVTSINNMKDICAVRGKNLNFYESGQHLQALEFDTTLSNLFIDANRDSRMYTAYMKYLRKLHELSPTLNCTFDSARAFTNKGSWGLVEYEDQSLVTAHKMRAWLDWLTETKQ